MAIAGVGTIIQMWDTGSSAWTALAEVTNINGPGFTRDMIEVTSLDSTGGWKEYLASFKDGGTVVISMNYTRASLDIFAASFNKSNANAVENYEIIFPDNTSIEFEAIVQDFPVTVAVGSQITMEVTVKVTGAPTINSGQNSAAPS